jgi:hypothetical protein
MGAAKPMVYFLSTLLYPSPVPTLLQYLSVPSSLGMKDSLRYEVRGREVEWRAVTGSMRAYTE